jgi:hypothetical protein
VAAGTAILGNRHNQKKKDKQYNWFRTQVKRESVSAAFGIGSLFNFAEMGAGFLQNVGMATIAWQYNASLSWR